MCRRRVVCLILAALTTLNILMARFVFRAEDPNPKMPFPDVQPSFPFSLRVIPIDGIHPVLHLQAAEQVADVTTLTTVKVEGAFGNDDALISNIKSDEEDHGTIPRGISESDRLSHYVDQKREAFFDITPTKTPSNVGLQPLIFVTPGEIPSRVTDSHFSDQLQVKDSTMRVAVDIAGEKKRAEALKNSLPPEQSHPRLQGLFRNGGQNLIVPEKKSFFPEGSTGNMQFLPSDSILQSVHKLQPPAGAAVLLPIEKTTIFENFNISNNAGDLFDVLSRYSPNSISDFLRKHNNFSVSDVQQNKFIANGPSPEFPSFQINSPRDFRYPLGPMPRKAESITPPGFFDLGNTNQDSRSALITPEIGQPPSNRITRAGGDPSSNFIANLKPRLSFARPRLQAVNNGQAKANGAYYITQNSKTPRGQALADVYQKMLDNIATDNGSDKLDVGERKMLSYFLQRISHFIQNKTPDHTSVA